MQPEDVEIDGENFAEYFRDVRTSVMERGDIIAQYTASAELVDGLEKRQLISLIRDTEGKMPATAQVMRRLLFASELDSYRVPRMMAEDILSGMSYDEVADKPYKYTLEMFFYSKLEHVPKSDPHWSVISVLNQDEIFDKKDDLHITSKIICPEADQ